MAQENRADHARQVSGAGVSLKKGRHVHMHSAGHAAAEATGTPMVSSPGAVISAGRAGERRTGPRSARRDAL